MWKKICRRLQNFNYTRRNAGGYSLKRRGSWQPSAAQALCACLMFKTVRTLSIGTGGGYASAIYITLFFSQQVHATRFCPTRSERDPPTHAQDKESL
jgi:protein-L-isoaspartate O-methyltransferase